MEYTFTPIATLHAPFKEKFGVPRQSGVVAEIHSTVELLPPYNRPEAVEGLGGFSHLWLQFLFHLNLRGQWQPMVRPPRLGGNRKVGVFASRAPFRPNPIGLSVVRIEAIHAAPGDVRIDIAGADLVDGTPILDIKPYVPYSDALPDAAGGFAQGRPDAILPVTFSERALERLLQESQGDELRTLIERLLEIDPRPAYRGEGADRKEYGMRLYDFDVKWRIGNERIEVLALEEAE